MSNEYAQLTDELRSLTKSCYIVNEKMPSRGYDRRWKIHLLLNDGSTIDRDTADDDASLAVELRRLVPLALRAVGEP